MAEEARSTIRPKKTVLNTQFDRELIVAARDEKTVHLFFSLDSLLDYPMEEADMVGNIIVVDRYMVKFKPVDTDKVVWIQKSHLAGVII